MEKVWFFVRLSKINLIIQHFWWIDLVNFESAGNILFPHKGTRKNCFPHVPKIHKNHKNTEYIPKFSWYNYRIIWTDTKTGMQLCKKQAGYKDSWGIENEVLVKSKTRTHLNQTEVLWPCSNPAGDDQTRPNTRIILIPVQNGNKPKERINPLVNENDDDFQYTLPSSPILEPVNWCVGEME